MAIITVIKSVNMSWAGHVAHKTGQKNWNEIIGDKSEKKRGVVKRTITTTILKKLGVSI